MNAKRLRTFILAAVAVGLVASAAPAQVFSPTQPGGKSAPPPGGKTFGPSGSGPSGGAPASPAPEKSAGTPPASGASVEKFCDDLHGKLKSLPKMAGKNSSSLAARCAGDGHGLGVVMAMRVVMEVCNVGGAELNASITKMLDGVIKGATEMITKECQ